MGVRAAPSHKEVLRMLTKRQNLLETIRGGKPDRYVNQYEALAMITDNPYSVNNPSPEYGRWKKCLGCHKCMAE